MKKQLFFNFRMAALAILTLIAVQSSFAQTTYTWTGSTSSDFLTATNWNAVPDFAVTNNVFSIGITGNNSDQVANAAAVSCRQITFGTGVTFNANADITTSSAATTSANGILNINAGTSTIPKFYTGNSSGVSGVVNVETGATLTGNNVWRVGANATATGTININGGTLTLGTAGSMALGYSNTGILNINSGTVNVNYTAFSSLTISANGMINIDAGSMVIPGNQTAAVQAFIDGGKIKTSGAALAAGKIISKTYDSVTDKTTVVAIAVPLGVNDVAIDANNIVVYSQNQSIKIQSGNVLLSEVNVYDVRGSLVASKKSIGSNEASIALDASNQVYVVKITTADGAVMTKKVMQ